MRKKRFLNSLIWMSPILFAVLVYYLYDGIPPEKEISVQEWAGLIAMSILPPLIRFAETTKLKERNETDPGLNKAKYPVPPKRMLYKQPEGFCFGKYKGKYICKRVDEPGSILVQGSSGSSKSTSTIQTFLLNPANKENCNCLVLDLKHELTDFCVGADEIYSLQNQTGKVIVLDPMDRQKGWGYDPFWQLNEESTETEVHEVMEMVADSIIPMAKGDSQVWDMSAKLYFRAGATYFYYYDKIGTLPAIIRELKSHTIPEIVEKVLAKAKPGDCCYVDMIGFKGMAEETYTSIDMNLSNRIVQFATSPDLVWCLESNPKKCNPADMLTKSIYLCVPENKLQKWSQLIFLVFNQYLTWMMSLPEKAEDPDRKYMAMILDETVALLAGIGAPMPLLTQCLRIGARGKGCTMLICCQSISGLYETMGKEQTKDLVANCQYKYVLDSTDSETSTEIIGWCGKYMHRKISSAGYGSKRKETTAYQEEDIVDEQELLTLPSTGEAILITNQAGYMRLEKVLSYKEPFFKYLRETVNKSKKKE